MAFFAALCASTHHLPHSTLPVLLAPTELTTRLNMAFSASLPRARILPLHLHQTTPLRIRSPETYNALTHTGHFARHVTIIPSAVESVPWSISQAIDCCTPQKGKRGGQAFAMAHSPFSHHSCPDPCEILGCMYVGACTMNTPMTPFIL